MRVNLAQAPSISPPSPPHHLSSTKLRLHRSPSTTLLTTSTTTLTRSKSTDLTTSLRRSCSASFDGHDFPHHHHNHSPIEDFTRKQNTHKTNFPTFLRNSVTTSFQSSQVDVLEPSLLGISPNPPEWPARDAVIRDCIAKRASSIELPLSLRMLKMKQKLQRLEEEREIMDLEEHMKKVIDNNNNDPINNLCCSALFIIREVQSQAFKSRGIVLDEELDDGIITKVQREMTSSFMWLFREVFAKTPDLMLQIMVLTSSFATHNLESLHLPIEKTHEIFKGVDVLEEEEKRLWNSMVEEANQIDHGSYLKNEGLEFVVDHDHLLKEVDDKIVFVSPVIIEVEGDAYEEYYRTDLYYQMGLLQEPNNTLLLSNYAQFLCLVSRDYDRAEQCFERAIQLDPTDGETITQYANFLWVVRKDLWAAEERFQQATEAEPENSYHASKYANFLWSTGGEETCYPLDPPLGMS